jgi:S1-C subfamily serine protease
VARGETTEELAVIPGSPADKAGITENDLILEADGVKLTGNKPLSSIVRNKKVGDVLTLKIWHKGSSKVMKVILEAAPN